MTRTNVFILYVVGMAVSALVVNRFTIEALENGWPFAVGALTALSFHWYTNRGVKP